MFRSPNNLAGFSHNNGQFPISNGTGFTNAKVPFVLSSTTVDLNSTAKQALYTVPTGKTLVITKIITRNASTSLTTAVFGFGFNAGANDVVAAALHTSLTDSTLMTIDSPINGAKLGAAGDILGIKPTIAQGVAATATVDVIGYLV